MWTLSVCRRPLSCERLQPLNLTAPPPPGAAAAAAYISSRGAGGLDAARAAFLDVENAAPAPPPAALAAWAAARDSAQVGGGAASTTGAAAIIDSLYSSEPSANPLGPQGAPDPILAFAIARIVAAAEAGLNRLPRESRLAVFFAWRVDTTFERGWPNTFREKGGEGGGGVLAGFASEDALVAFNSAANWPGGSALGTPTSTDHHRYAASITATAPPLSATLPAPFPVSASPLRTLALLYAIDADGGVGVAGVAIHVAPAVSGICGPAGNCSGSGPASLLASATAACAAAAAPPAPPLAGALCVAALAPVAAAIAITSTTISSSGQANVLAGAQLLGLAAAALASADASTINSLLGPLAGALASLAGGGPCSSLLAATVCAAPRAAAAVALASAVQVARTGGGTLGEGVVVAVLSAAVGLIDANGVSQGGGGRSTDQVSPIYAAASVVDAAARGGVSSTAVAFLVGASGACGRTGAQATAVRGSRDAELTLTARPPGGAAFVCAAEPVGLFAPSISLSTGAIGLLFPNASTAITSLIVWGASPYDESAGWAASIFSLSQNQSRSLGVLVPSPSPPPAVVEAASSYQDGLAIAFRALPPTPTTARDLLPNRGLDSHVLYVGGSAAADANPTARTPFPAGAKLALLTLPLFPASFGPALPLAALSTLGPVHRISFTCPSAALAVGAQVAALNIAASPPENADLRVVSTQVIAVTTLLAVRLTSLIVPPPEVWAAFRGAPTSAPSPLLSTAAGLALVTVLNANCGATRVTFACGPGFEGVNTTLDCPPVFVKPICAVWDAGTAAWDASGDHCAVATITHSAITCACDAVGIAVGIHLAALTFPLAPTVFSATVTLASNTLTPLPLLALAALAVVILATIGLARLGSHLDAAAVDAARVALSRTPEVRALSAIARVCLVIEIAFARSIDAAKLKDYNQIEEKNAIENPTRDDPPMPGPGSDALRANRVTLASSMPLFPTLRSTTSPDELGPEMNESAAPALTAGGAEFNQLAALAPAVINEPAAPASPAAKGAEARATFLAQRAEKVKKAQAQRAAAAAAETVATSVALVDDTVLDAEADQAHPGGLIQDPPPPATDANADADKSKPTSPSSMPQTATALSSAPSKDIKEVTNKFAMASKATAKVAPLPWGLTSSTLRSTITAYADESFAPARGGLLGIFYGAAPDTDGAAIVAVNRLMRGNCGLLAPRLLRLPITRRLPPPTSFLARVAHAFLAHPLVYAMQHWDAALPRCVLALACGSGCLSAAVVCVYTFAPSAPLIAPPLSIIMSAIAAAIAAVASTICTSIITLLWRMGPGKKARGLVAPHLTNDFRLRAAADAVFSPLPTRALALLVDGGAEDPEAEAADAAEAEVNKDVVGGANAGRRAFRACESAHVNSQGVDANKVTAIAAAARAALAKVIADILPLGPSDLIPEMGRKGGGGGRSADFFCPPPLPRLPLARGRRCSFYPHRLCRLCELPRPRSVHRNRRRCDLGSVRG